MHITKYCLQKFSRITRLDLHCCWIYIWIHKDLLASELSSCTCIGQDAFSLDLNFILMQIVYLFLCYHPNFDIIVFCCFVILLLCTVLMQYFYLANITSNFSYNCHFVQNGSMLLSQFLHDDPVLKLKCRTWQPHKNYGSAEQVLELQDSLILF